MVTANPLEDLYAELDLATQQVLQVLSIANSSLSEDNIVRVFESCNVTVRKKTVKATLSKLDKLGLVVRSRYRDRLINIDMQDFVMQDSVRQGTFVPFCDAVKMIHENQGCYSNNGREMRLAFYRGDTGTYQKLRKNRVSEQMPPLLQPFSADIFEQLDPILQALYLTDAAGRMIVQPTGNKTLLLAFDKFIAESASREPEFLAAWMDVAVACGNIELLKQLDKKTSNKHTAEISGCIAFLQGDYDDAKTLLASGIAGGRRKGKLAAIDHFPAIFYLVLLLRDDQAESIVEARGIIRSIRKAKGCYFASSVDILKAAFDFKQSTTTLREFTSFLAENVDIPFERLLAGYLVRWLLADEDTKYEAPGLVSVANQYASTGLDWLAAEVGGLVGKSGLKSAAVKWKNHGVAHKNMGTKSLVDFIRAEPSWRRLLTSIAQVAEEGSSHSISNPTSKADVVTERMIWELDTKYPNISLGAYVQKRQGKGWSKGRKVSSERLYERHNESDFSFMTDRDHSLCNAIVATTDQNYYGYNETLYRYNDRKAAPALIGHPCIFQPGDRENPLDVIEKSPELFVTEGKAGEIRLSLDPEPLRKDNSFRMIKDGPGRIAMVTFTDKHLRLHKILQGGLSIPASAANEVIRAIEPVTRLISVHSELDVVESGSDTSAGDSNSESSKVDSDSRPHLHLLPFQDGLRAEFYVRPFGEIGPFCRPGEGGTTVFFNVDGQSRSAKRDFDREQQLREEILAACPMLDAVSNGDAPICLPTPCEALTTLIELEELADRDRVFLHWPKGRSLHIAGNASAAQFQISVRRDHDWFAASGVLKVSKTLQIDMMELIDLVDASPSRFVKLDDGKFLALTEQLRQRVKELSVYGDRRSKQNKLRFPKVHAVVLDDLGETCKLKADKHWKEWTQRMRHAGDVQAEVPSTLQTELRDYQVEGFRWLARLAAWGVGGCLADDMGLGKTIQALALLLHRATDGPALVVAPTSVAFNWQAEARKFAPTLNVHLFGEGDRDQALKKLGPGDVVICSYGLLHTEAKILQSMSWHTVILDEAQAIKNMATQRSKAAMGLQADFRMIMTGTPLENHLGELWNLMEFANPGLLGGYDSFQNRFANPIQLNGCRETRRQLKKLIQPFILRRTKSQVLEELPPRTEVTLQVTLSDEESALYEAIRERALERLADAGGGGAQHLKILAELMRLRRVCCHPSLVMDDCSIPGSKLALFSKTIDELVTNNHKVLVFSQFVDHLTILRKELERKEVTYQYLDGSTPAKKRKTIVEAFQGGEGDVFLISLKAGGTGLNLTAADYVIHMDPWWNPAVEDQASDRAHRIGQQRPVTVYRLITEGTIEKRITELHASKRDLADSLLEGTDVSSKLTAKELLKLLRE